MSLPTPWSLAVRTRTEGELDEFGNATTTTSEHEWPVSFIAPGALTDVDDGTRDLSKVAFTIGAPKSDRAPGYRDEVRIDGTWYAVNGAPKDWTRGPFGFAPGVTVEVEVVDG